MRGTIARGVLPPCAGSHVVAGMSTRRLLVPAASVSNDCTRMQLVAANHSNDSTTRRQCWPQPIAVSPPLGFTKAPEISAANFCKLEPNYYDDMESIIMHTHTLPYVILIRYSCASTRDVNPHAPHFYICQKSYVCICLHRSYFIGCWGVSPTGKSEWLLHARLKADREVGVGGGRGPH